jgi:FAD/FMN-containing dehydrogenase
VRAQRQLIGALGDTAPAPSSIWRALAEIEPAGAAVARVSAPPSRLHALWSRLAGDDGVLVHATVGRGIVRTIRPSSEAAALATWLERIARCEGTHIFERLPADSWSAVPSRVNDALSRAVRDAFDPARILNRGILGELS